MFSKKMKRKVLKESINASKVDFSRSNQIIALYENRNDNGLKKLSLSELDQIEQNTMQFLDSLKREKVLKGIISQLQTTEDSQVKANQKILIDCLRQTSDTGSKTTRISHPFSFSNEFFTPVETTMNPKNPKKPEMKKLASLKASVVTNGDLRSSLGIEAKEKHITSPQIQNFESFQTYFTAVHASDQNEFLHNEQQENLDRRLNKLKNTYKKMTEQFGMPNDQSQTGGGHSAFKGSPLQDKDVNTSAFTDKKSAHKTVSLQDLDRKNWKSNETVNSFMVDFKTVSICKDNLAVGDDDENVGANPINVSLVSSKKRAERVLNKSAQKPELDSSRVQPSPKVYSPMLAGQRVYSVDYFNDLPTNKK